MSEICLIERAIEIDAGHRVTHHASKCKNLHGHRYKIIAICKGPLVTQGEQQGMVLDFGFLKEEMMREVHEACDHAMILGVDDPLAERFIEDQHLYGWEIRPQVAKTGYYRAEKSMIGALYIMGTVPTAENLAMHWFERLQPRVQERSAKQAHLHQVKVFETPNCAAVYPAHEPARQESAHEAKER